MESAFVKFAICVFVLFFQINQGLDKKKRGEGGEGGSTVFLQRFQSVSLYYFYR